MNEANLKLAISAIMQRTAHLSSHHGKAFALHQKQADREKAIWYAAQHRLIEHLHHFFAGGDIEDGCEHEDWAKTELDSLDWYDDN